ncbi:pentatricopeptide repeat-containing protein At3g12770-like [Cryptomeria japonica]|uniref:pentatricopeptide repeat-containing protein At3g12770-like n=1 Tax=Cryptomeria japonica TaxID=3369 RepID=UPI0027DA3FF7|nr:pentatricopeptide repeat-containing protein At3g12770-like [Cryptomeria japonica]
MHSFFKLFQTCSNIKQLQQIHGQIIATGLAENEILGSRLISAYGKRQSVDYARLVFDRIPKESVFLWNSMITGYSKNGFWDKTLELFCQMQNEQEADHFTFPCVLKACAAISALQKGREVHVRAITCGLESDLFTANALITMYAKCRRVEDARKVFDKMCPSERDTVSWNSMVGGYVQNGKGIKALELYIQMKTRIEPDAVTFISLLPIFSDVNKGKEIHACILSSGLHLNLQVGNALVAMYAKCDIIECALKMFDGMLEKDVVSWTAMITGYVQNGQSGEALKLFHKMQLAGVKPNAVTIISVLPACTALVALQQGKEVHNSVVRNGFESDVFVVSTLIDMYAKCGSLKIALHLFNTMAHKDPALWTAMISSYSINGCPDEAIRLFDRMLALGYKPDSVTFVAVLSACSRAGMVVKGWRYFDRMKLDYCIVPGLEHYACIVDLLGRAGHLDEAYDFIGNMPLKPNDDVWGALLGACRIHQNIQLGELVAEHLYDLKPKKAGYYVLMSNIYAAAGRWDGVEKVRAIMKDKRATKMPGYAWIEIKKKVHAFLVEDRAHAQSAEIYKTLEDLAGKMKEAGYVPNTNFVLQDVEEEEKEHILCSHSEKLALAFGLMNIKCPGTSIRIIKNLRICGDCHHAMKFISRIVEREIIIRDLSRFHHFKNGECSCGNYW